MSNIFSYSNRDALEQVVRLPGFRQLSMIPLIAWPPILLLVICYVGFATSLYFYLADKMHWGAVIAINVVLTYLAFTVVHDATHRSVSSNSTLNDGLGNLALLFWLPGITTAVYRYLHLEHHRYIGDPVRDPDDVFVTTRGPWLIPILTLIEIPWVPYYLRHWSSRPKIERLRFAGGMTFYALWHAFWLASPYWREFLICWFIPQRIGIFITAYLFAHIQHPKGIQWENQPFQATYRIKSRKFLELMMCGQAVHCLHHLVPSIPFYRYHRAWDAGKVILEARNIPVRGFTWKPNPSTLSEVKEPVIDAKIVSIRTVAKDVKEFTLEAVSQRALPDYTAGSHIDVLISDNFARQYSLTDRANEQNHYRIAVKKEDNGRGGSERLHEGFKVGDAIRIGLPRNRFPLSDSAKRYFLVAGGIGATPILAMAHALQARGADFNLHMFARTAEALPYGAELSSVPFVDRLSIHLDNDPATRFDPVLNIGEWQEGYELYLCGPAAFMTWVQEILATLGWPPHAIILERFTQIRFDTSQNQPFEVQLARSGKVLRVPADGILLNVLHANGIAVPCSCTQGICGSCLTPVLAGEPDHRDVVLTDAERESNRLMAVCVGRSRGERLVLDL